MSRIVSSIIERRPRAPVLRAKASCAMARKASSLKSILHRLEQLGVDIA